MLKRTLSLCLCLLYFSTPFSQATVKTLDSIVAVVNEDVITQTELSKSKQILLQRLQPEQTQLPPENILNKQVLNKLILDKIQLQLAKQLGIDIDSISLNQTLKQIANEEGMSLQEFRHTTESQGLSFQDFKERVKTELILSQLHQREVGHSITVSESEIDNHLNSPLGQNQAGTEYRLGHILIPIDSNQTQAEIKQIKAKASTLVNNLKAGKTKFKQAAMRESAGQQALNGGMLDWRTIHQLPTIFINYIPTMQLGDVVGPIQNSSGFHIIKLVNKRIGKQELQPETLVSQILLTPNEKLSDNEARVKLEQLKQQLDNGADFADLARQYSQETNTASNGGELGWMTTSSVLPKFLTKMNELAVGEISKPFQTELGWHLIKVSNRRTQSASLETARATVANHLYQRKFNDKLDIWLKEIRQNANVKFIENS